MWRSRVGRAVAVCLALMTGHSALTQPVNIAPPFDPAAFVAGPGKLSSSVRRAECPPPIAPLVDMAKMGTFYANERTRSVVDRGQLASYVVRLRPQQQFMRRLLTLNQRWIAVPQARPATAKCIAMQLRSWADAGALLGNVDANDSTGHRQAILIMAWSSVGIATAYQTAARSQAISPDDARAIRAWAVRLSGQIRGEFTPRLDRLKWLEGTSNHSSWAGAAVAALSSITGSRSDFDWAMGELRRDIAAAGSDGALPREMGRGKRALHYQNFAMQPLALLVRSADANRVALTGAEEAMLARMAVFTATAWQDPTGIQRRTGVPQERNGGMLSWVDMLAPHLRVRRPDDARRIEAIAAPFRPFASQFLGLDATKSAGVLK